MKKYNKVLMTLFISVVFAFISFAMVSAENNLINTGSTCANHPNRMWAWTKDGAWLSMTKTGNWKTDDWFYMLKSGEPVVVTQIDGEKGYYLVCYDFGSDDGWQPLVGWVYKDKILLQSQITPIAP